MEKCVRYQAPFLVELASADLEVNRSARRVQYQIILGVKSIKYTRAGNGKYQCIEHEVQSLEVHSQDYWRTCNRACA